MKIKVKSNMKSNITGILCILYCLLLFSCPDPVKIDNTVYVTGISFNESTISIAAGMSKLLTVSILPSNALNQTVSWNSGDIDIVTVDNGLVTAVAIGSADITISSEDGNFSDTCTVTVTSFISAVGITLNSGAETILVDGTTQLSAAFDPVNASNQSITWSSNNAAATVSDSGLVTGVSVGSAIITATSVDGSYTDTCVLTVDPVPVAGIEIDTLGISIQPSATEQFNVVFNPVNATNKNVTWSSDNDLIVEVDSNGMVTGIAEGLTFITVTTADGSFTDSCTVVVDGTDPYIYSVSLLNSSTISISILEIMNFTNITSILNYSLISDPSGSAVNAVIDSISAEFGNNGFTSIIITTANVLPLGVLSVSISNLTDLAGNLISTGNNPFIIDIASDHGCVVDISTIVENVGIVSFSAGAVTLPGGNWDPASFNIMVFPFGENFSGGTPLAYGKVESNGSILSVKDLFSGSPYVFSDGSYDIYVIGNYNSTQVAGENFSTMIIPVL